MRYFLVFYRALNGSTTVFGNMAISLNRFPSRRQLISHIEEENPIVMPNSVMLTNLIELTEGDFLQWIEK